MDQLKLMRWFVDNYGVSELTRDEPDHITVSGYPSEYHIYKRPESVKLTISTEKFALLMEQLYQLECEVVAREYNSAVADAYNKYRVLLELCK